jgi:hypothetical protein
MQNDGVWPVALEKKYNKMKEHMIQMHSILKTVIDGANMIKAEIGSKKNNI